jgi:hypothetical protein
MNSCLEHVVDGISTGTTYPNDFDDVWPGRRQVKN